MAQSTMKKGLYLSLLSVLGCLFALALLEIALRAFGYEAAPSDDPIAIWNKELDRDLRLGRGLHRAAAGQLWEPRPGAALPVSWTGELERVNDGGFRGPQRSKKKPDGILRIATLGDSSTFGYGVPYAQTYSAGLESGLSEAGRKVEVLDFGVVGFTLLQGIERYGARVREYDPDVVVAAFGSVNDHHLAQGAPDAQKIASATSSESRLGVIGNRAREHSRVFQLLGSAVDSFRDEDVEQREALQRRQVELDAALPHVGKLDFEISWHGVRRVAVTEFEAGLVELKRRVEADGAILVVVSMPRRPGVEFESPVLRKYSQAVMDFGQAGCAFFDARVDFRNYREIEHGDPSLFFLDGDDYHPSRRGHARIARGLTATILQAVGSH